MLEQYKILKSYAKKRNTKYNLDDYYLSYISNSVIIKSRELKGKEKKEYINKLKKLRVFDNVLVDTLIRKLKMFLMKININLYLKVVKWQKYQ